jgi:hypothetical protein
MECRECNGIIISIRLQRNVVSLMVQEYVLIYNGGC